MLSPNTPQSRPISESCATLPGLIFPAGGLLGSGLDLGQGWQRGVLEALQVQHPISILVLQSLKLLFEGLFMRELKELTAVSDLPLLVGFLLLEYKGAFYFWHFPFCSERVQLVPLAETRLHEHPIWACGTITAIIEAWRTWRTPWRTLWRHHASGPVICHNFWPLYFNCLTIHSDLAQMWQHNVLTKQTRDLLGCLHICPSI